MAPDTYVYQTEQPQISYSLDFTAEQSWAIQSPKLLGREGTQLHVTQLHMHPQPRHTCMAYYDNDIMIND